MVKKEWFLLKYTIGLLFPHLHTNPFMRRFIKVLVLVTLSTLTGCDETYNDDATAGPSGVTINTISKTYSPDKTKLLTVKEYVVKGPSGHTQVFIEFKNSGSGVYSIDTVGVDIKAYWVDNHEIVIETRKSYVGNQKFEQVQNFSDIVKVRYVER